MTPVLLDQRSIFRAGVSLSLGMFVIFFTGYYIGHQKADSGKTLGLNKTIALALPSPAHADTAAYDPLIPTAEIPGANIDVDSPGDKAVDSVSEAQVTHRHQAEAQIEAVIKETTDNIEKPVASDRLAGQGDDQLQLASLAVTPGVFKAGSEAGIIEEAGDKQLSAAGGQPSSDNIETGVSENIIDTASAENARYTIQVGVFADSENAIRRMSELESQNLSAYTDGYTNKRDELRFNVRFGYFKNMSSAKAALSSFQQNMSGNGYIARIRRN